MATLASTFNQTTSESCCRQSSILMAVPCSLFQLKHFIILFALMLHPYGNSCSQTNSESCLEVPSCRQLLTLLVSESAQHSADFECPSLRQLRTLLPAGPPLLFLSISCNIFFKDTIQSSAIILIDNNFSPSLIILSTLVRIFPSKLPFSAIVSLSPISSFVLMLKPN